MTQIFLPNYINMLLSCDFAKLYRMSVKKHFSFLFAIL